MLECTRNTPELYCLRIASKRLLIPALCWAPFRHIDVLQNPTPEVLPNTDDP